MILENKLLSLIERINCINPSLKFRPGRYVSTYSQLLHLILLTIIVTNSIDITENWFEYSVNSGVD